MNSAYSPSRRGGPEHVQVNARWLAHRHGPRVQLLQRDITDAQAVRHAVEQASVVYHFAAQVAVTTSLQNPRADFEVNAHGTLNVLEALRRCGRAVPMLFTSTNKVYGSLPTLTLDEGGRRYTPSAGSTFEHGIGEVELDFHSPYGCSKGAADQYVLDYTRTFGLQAVVFCMSCIYGPHQRGNADQGWVAHFARAALESKPIVIYGDGKQVRDVLYIDDLIDAMRLATRHIDRTAGQAYNVGGDTANTLSLMELCGLLEELTGRPLHRRNGPWRTGDQKYYVSDTRKLRKAIGWEPQTTVRHGVTRLLKWLDTTQPTQRPPHTQAITARADRREPTLASKE